MSRSESTVARNANASRPPSPWSSVSAAWRLLRAAGIGWQRDNAMRLSAAVAMYAMLSLAPLLVITIKATALVLSEESASRQVESQVNALLGSTGAAAVKDMVAHALEPGSGMLATAVSLAVLLYTASGVFVELRDSLNALWGIKPRAGGNVWALVRKRLLSFGMVLAIGFLLLVSMVVSTVLTVLSEFLLGGSGWASVLVDLVASTIVIALLFATLFRVSPDARLSWRDVLFGAVVTAVLFKAGQFVMALYFTYGSTASAYGAAGSFVVVLLWVYYSCWLLFYGAELIQEFARSEGRRIEPAVDAGRSEKETRNWRNGSAVPRAGEPAESVR